MSEFGSSWDDPMIVRDALASDGGLPSPTPCDDCRSANRRLFVASVAAGVVLGCFAFWMLTRV